MLQVQGFDAAPTLPTTLLSRTRCQVRSWDRLLNRKRRGLPCACWDCSCEQVGAGQRGKVSAGSVWPGGQRDGGS